MAMDVTLRKFIEEMPKIELHLHIEGSLEPEMAFMFAQRNGLAFDYNPNKAEKKLTVRSKYALPEQGSRELQNARELKKLYKFNNLDEFLDVYYAGMGTLKTEQDYYDLTMAYLQKIKDQHVTHTEIFFDPQEHTARGVPLSAVINGIKGALDDAKKNMGISSKLIMSFVRHRSQQEAFDCLQQAAPLMDKIDGIGLDSSEKPFPPEIFAEVFAKAKNDYPKLKLVAHAGEEGPADYVTTALDVLKVDRIDHGNHALDDAALVDRLVKEGKGLTVCPLSNLRLCHTLDFDTDRTLTDLKDHPLKKMLDLGLKASVNSDDPAYFRTDDGRGGYMTENYLAVAGALNLTAEHVVKLAQNAIDTSFLSPEQKEQKTLELQAYVAKAASPDRRINTAGGAHRGAI